MQFSLMHSTLGCLLLNTVTCAHTQGETGSNEALGDVELSVSPQQADTVVHSEDIFFQACQIASELCRSIDL